MNGEPTHGTDTPPDVPPADQPVADDLPIAAWVNDCNYDLDLACARTVGDLRDEAEKWFRRVPLSAQFCLAVFAGPDGRMYAVNIGAIVRPATPDEVREAVEIAKEDARDVLEERIKELDGHLKAAE